MTFEVSLRDVGRALRKLMSAWIAGIRQVMRPYHPERHYLRGPRNGNPGRMADHGKARSFPRC